MLHSVVVFARHTGFLKGKSSRLSVVAFSHDNNLFLRLNILICSSKNIVLMFFCSRVLLHNFYAIFSARSDPTNYKDFADSVHLLRQERNSLRFESRPMFPMVFWVENDDHENVFEEYESAFDLGKNCHFSFPLHLTFMFSEHWTRILPTRFPYFWRCNFSYFVPNFTSKTLRVISGCN